MNMHCSNRGQDNCCDSPLMEESWRNIDSFEAGDTSSDQEYNTWSFLGRFGSYPGPATLAEPGRRKKFSKQHASCSQKSSSFDISDKLGRNDIWTFGGKTGALRIISCLNPIQGWGADTMAESFLQIRRKTNVEGEKQELASIPSFPGLLDTGYPNLRFK